MGGYFDKLKNEMMKSLDGGSDEKQGTINQEFVHTCLIWTE